MPFALKQKARAAGARPVVLCLAIALLALLGACSPPTATPSPTATPAPPPEPTATLPAPTATPVPASTATPAPSPTAPAPSPEELLDELIGIASKLRGLETLNEVPLAFLSPDEMRQRVRDMLEEDLDEEELEIDRRLLVLLDLIDPALDLERVLVDLYSDAVVGFYHTEEKEMVVRRAGGEIGPAELSTLVHELTHALQDQHFDLFDTRERLREEDNGDRIAAYTALVEGDAVLTETIYVFQYLTEEERFLLFLGGGDGPDLTAVPEYLIRTLVFPYSEGAEFVAELYLDGGWDAVNRAYEELPSSTSHILHPRKYLEGVEPVSVDLAPLEDALAGPWDVLQANVMGEFVLYLYLNSYLADETARQAAEGWRGDRYLYLEDADEEGLFVMLTHWDDAGEAIEFFDTYIAFIGAKSGGAWGVAQPDAHTRRWDAGDGREVLLRLDGETVLLVLSPRAGATQAVEDALQG